MPTQEEYAQQLLADLNNLGVGTTEKMGKGERMKPGHHVLALINLGFKKNMKTKDKRIQAEFEVISSDVYQPGAKTSLSFFVQRTEYPEYEVSRFQEMMGSVGAGLGFAGTQAELGAICMTSQGRGIVLDLEVAPDLDEDGNIQRGKTGTVYTTETWAPYTQTWDEVAENNKILSERYGAWAPMGERSVPQNAGYQQQVQQPPQQPAPKLQAGPAPGSQFVQPQQPAPAAAPAARPSLLRRP